jgi:hypothetical protein
MIVRTVKVDITPEAAARIAELGLENEFERVAEYTRSAVPTLSEIRVETWIDYEEGAGPYLRLTATKDGPYVRRDPDVQKWKRGLLEFTSYDFNRWCSIHLYPRGLPNDR